MKTIHRQFVIRLLIISIVVYAVLYFICQKLSISYMPITAMVALLFGVNTLAFIIVTNTKEKNPRSFVYSYMTVGFIRLLVFTAFAVSYALLHRHDARPFALAFFILYFVYTIVEVNAVYTFFKN